MADTNKDEPLFLISVVSEMLNVHPQTLRLYEKEGLIKPSRTEGNTRLYSQRDMERIRSILLLTRELGVNLAGVEVVLGMRDTIEEMQHNIDEMNEFIRMFMGEQFETWKKKRQESLVRTGPGKVVRLSAQKE